MTAPTAPPKFGESFGMGDFSLKHAFSRQPEQAEARASYPDYAALTSGSADTIAGFLTITEAALAAS